MDEKAVGHAHIQIGLGRIDLPAGIGAGIVEQRESEVIIAMGGQAVADKLALISKGRALGEDGLKGGEAAAQCDPEGQTPQECFHRFRFF